MKLWNLIKINDKAETNYSKDSAPKIFATFAEANEAFLMDAHAIINTDVNADLIDHVAPLSFHAPFVAEIKFKDGHFYRWHIVEVEC